MKIYQLNYTSTYSRRASCVAVVIAKDEALAWSLLLPRVGRASEWSAIELGETKETDARIVAHEKP